MNDDAWLIEDLVVGRIDSNFERAPTTTAEFWYRDGSMRVFIETPGMAMARWLDPEKRYVVVIKEAA